MLPRLPMGRVSAVTTTLLLLLVSLLPVAIGESAGDVNFSVDSLALSPSSPVEGEDVQVTATLMNAISTEITGVVVSLHPDSDQNPAFHTETVSILGDSFVQVVGTWSDIPFGTHSVVLVVTHNGSTNSVSKGVEVSGQIDLVASNIILTPTSDLHQGDLIDISLNVTNEGNLDAPASHVLIQLDGTTLSELSVPSLFAGASTVVQTSFNAPAAGSHQISAIANSANDGITESNTDNNDANPASFTVLSEPDFLHYGQPSPEISVSTDVGVLTGPWTLSGEILRMGGSGDETISIAILLIEASGETTVSTFQLTFTDSAPLQAWQHQVSTLQMPELSAGEHTLRVRIDPSRQVPQSIQFNDDLDTQISVHPEPNVVVSPHASSSSDSVLSGEQVSFEVTVTNTGTIAIIGDLTAIFDGNTLTPILGIGIPAGEERTFNFSGISSGTESRTLQFTASWTANGASYDSQTDDNTAYGTVVLRSNLRLRFLQQSESWTPSDTPMVVGTTYTYTVDIVSEEGTGSEIFTCFDHGEGETLSVKEIEFSSVNYTSTVICSFTPEKAGNFELYVVPTGSSVATWTTGWSISAVGNSGPDTDSTTDSQATILFIIAAILLIAVLVAAFVLSRTIDEELERETFEYCPSCDGEIEGDEEMCPHCDFDLVEGLSQFHDCPSCNSNIPDMMEHCPYCGLVQDVSSFYEQRERKEKVVEEMDEILEDDEDEIVLGTEGYGDAISEMGYDEDQLESDWDENLGAAEAEIDAAIAQRELESEMLEEESEEDLVITQMRQTHEEHRVELDDIIGDKEGRRHLSDDDVKLSASDADIRADIFEITGEDGILPGQEVEVEFIPDNTVVGNELKERTEVTDFTVESDGPQPAKISDTVEEMTEETEPVAEDDSEKKTEDGSKRRRSVRRRGNDDE